MTKINHRHLTRKLVEEKYGGGPCELIMTEPCTYRQIIQYYYHLTHVNPSCDMSVAVQEIKKDIKYAWSVVNPRLPVITDKSIDKKIKDLLILVKDINRKHCKPRAKNNLDAKLNSLFDISACSCSLDTVPCSDSRVLCKIDHCVQEHIICVCSRGAKVPREDRAYLRDQRSKIGPKGTYQLSSVDKVAVKRQRRTKQKQGQEPTEEPVEQLPGSSMIAYLPEDIEGSKCEEEHEWQPRKITSGVYNLAKFPRYAMELVRGECSSRLGAALANALLHDIKHLLKPDIDINEIIIDKCKLDRAKAQVRVVSEGVKSENNKRFICIGVDGKVDHHTLTYKNIDSRKDEFSCAIKKCVESEHHLTFTSEDGKSSGTYLTHRTVPIIGTTGGVLAQETLDVLQEYDSIDSIQAILLDNTAINTGHKSGLVVNLEELLGRKLHIIGCALHQNELPLRAIFRKSDNVTTGPNSFSGSIGQRCAENLQDTPQVTFEAVKTPIIDGYMPEKVLKDLSHDQRLLYEYCKGIGSGKVDERWAGYKISPLNHARWLTLAIRLLCLYTRDKKPNLCLKKLVQFIVQVYAPAWFEIKASSKLHDAPRILFSALTRLNLLTYSDVKAIAKKNIQGNAFCLLPENFLYAMAKDDEKLIRNFGLQSILNIRQRMEVDQKLEKVNWNAKHRYEFIDLTADYVVEPPTTRHFTDAEIQSFIDNNIKPDIPDFPSHSQSVERSVKLVSKASNHVYGFENRHRSILTKVLSRNLRQPFMSK